MFLDLKYHDIPNTVAAAVHEAAQLGVSMLRCMLRVAPRCCARPWTRPAPLIPIWSYLAVTVLTSMDADDLEKIGIQSTVQDEVLRLALWRSRAGARDCHLSARSFKLRAGLGSDFAIVTPGVRPAGSGWRSGTRGYSGAKRLPLEQATSWSVAPSPKPPIRQRQRERFCERSARQWIPQYSRARWNSLTS